MKKFSSFAILLMLGSLLSCKTEENKNSKPVNRAFESDYFRFTSMSTISSNNSTWIVNVNYPSISKLYSDLESKLIHRGTTTKEWDETFITSNIPSIIRYYYVDSLNVSGIKLKQSYVLSKDGSSDKIEEYDDALNIIRIDLIRNYKYGLKYSRHFCGANYYVPNQNDLRVAKKTIRLTTDQTNEFGKNTYFEFTWDSLNTEEFDTRYFDAENSCIYDAATRYNVVKVKK